MGDRKSGNNVVCVCVLFVCFDFVFWSVGFRGFIEDCVLDCIDFFLVCVVVDYYCWLKYLEWDCWKVSWDG